MAIDENTRKIIRHMPNFLQDGQNLFDLTNSVAQELELSIEYLDTTKEQIQLSTSTGTRLDALGQLLNVARNTDELDDDYRARIQSKFNLSISSGTILEIKNALISLTGISAKDITIEDIKPGIIKISAFIGSNFGLVDTFFDTITSTKAAGVYVVTDISSSLDDSLTISDTVLPEEIVDIRIYGLFVYGEELSKY